MPGSSILYQFLLMMTFIELAAREGVRSDIVGGRLPLPSLSPSYSEEVA